MTRARRTTAIAALGAAVLTVLVGCSASGGSGYALLDADASSDRSIPPLPDHALDDVDEATLRYAGASEGTELWIARGAEGATVCLLVYPGEDGWVTACGGDSGPLETSSADATYRLQPDGLPVPDGWTAVTGNVLRRA